MAKIEFTATHPKTGASSTRTSGTMAYTHAIVFPEGGVSTWHLTEAAAIKARQSQGEGTVVAVVPTAVIGAAQVGDFSKFAQAEVIDALIEAKNAPKPKAERKPRAKKSAQERMDERVEAAAKSVPTEAQRAEAVEKALAEVEASDPVTTAPEVVSMTVDEVKEALGVSPSEDHAPVEVIEAAISAGEAHAAATNGQVKVRQPSKKQQLGALVHAAVNAVIERGEFPEGMSADDAVYQLETWLRYIPNGARATGSRTWEANHAQA